MIHHTISEDHFLYTETFAGMPVGMIEFYSNPPISRNGPHLDRGRWCALNIPIDVDFDNSHFFVGKTHVLKNYNEVVLEKSPYDTNTNHQHSDGPSGFFQEEEEKFHYYNLEKPALFSTKTPHGCENWSYRERVICSIAFGKRKFEEMHHQLPQSWF